MNRLASIAPIHGKRSLQSEMCNPAMLVEPSLEKIDLGRLPSFSLRYRLTQNNVGARMSSSCERSQYVSIIREVPQNVYRTKICLHDTVRRTVTVATTDPNRNAVIVSNRIWSSSPFYSIFIHNTRWCLMKPRERLAKKLDICSCEISCFQEGCIRNLLHFLKLDCLSPSYFNPAHCVSLTVEARLKSATLLLVGSHDERHWTGGFIHSI